MRIVERPEEQERTGTHTAMIVVEADTRNAACCKQINEQALVYAANKLGLKSPGLSLHAPVYLVKDDDGTIRFRCDLHIQGSL